MTMSSVCGAMSRWPITADHSARGEARDKQQIASAKLNKSLSVAVVGAGAGGIAATRELLKEGHRVVVFEQEIDGLGGVWRFSHRTEDEDPLGLSSDRSAIHSSMYLGLRTNLPREIMGFLDFPFLPKYGDSSRDARRYPGHVEVLDYLEDYAVHFGLLPCIRFGRRVTRVCMHARPKTRDDALIAPDCSNSGGCQWSVTTVAERDCKDCTTDMFDAVVVCNGHYFQPKLAPIPGIEEWPGIRLHSHNYRVPDPFADQVVVVIGNSSSGSDISREIATVAKAVHLVGRTWDSDVDLQKPAGPKQNISLHPMVKSAHEDGKLVFENGDSVIADVILYCTGYAYSMPFLQTEEIVNVNADYVGPLYQHVFPPRLAPTLSFVGLPFKVIPFPLMQLQSRWIAQSLSGKVTLPSEEQMLKDSLEFYERLDARGIPTNKIHDMGSYQFEYDNWLAAACDSSPIEPWRIQIYNNSSKRKRASPDTYRDEWSDQELHDLAIAELQQLQIV
ncbi:hypothetical protein KP509_34G032600 [Ceratopteris richardii]|uniref:Flavin-containing monooxygenase n=1 Tax=Ceratopteris richardii TaxID=49495 RepID=A0A8T2QIM5_CERRI|nr:hypothetical protein KP509_34G032600 [Ceratopteris richardii]